MRVQQAKALVWEIWQANRVGLVVVTVAVPLAAYLVQLLVASRAELVLGIIKLSLFASLLHLSMVFCYSDFSARTLQTGFPRHALLLPVPTWLLLAVPFLTGVVFLFVYIVGWINLIGVFSISRGAHAYVLLALSIGVAWLQAIS